MDTVRTPTRSEVNTFKVLSNLEFTNLGRTEPQGWSDNVSERRVQPSPDRMKTPERKPEEEVRPEADEARPDTRLEARPELRPEVSELRPDKRPEVSELRPDVRDEIKDELRDEMRREYEEPRETRWEDPELIAKAKAVAENDVRIEKEGLLYEIELMEKQGLLKLHRTLTMENSLDEIQYQYDRANMIVSTQQTVDWAKTGIKVGSGVLEALVKKFGLHAVDGFSKNLCKDMNKFNKPLTKMYRKYWRRGTSSPEMELAMIVFGALAMTVMGNKGLMGSKPVEPLARPVPPEPSIMKAPFSGSPSAPSAPSATAPSATAPSAPSATPSAPTPYAAVPLMPEWARNALSEQPKHFAQVQPKKPEIERLDTFPELARPLQIPIMPRVVEPQTDTVAAPTVTAQMPVNESPKKAEEDAVVKRLTLTNSPRSTRRKRTDAPVISM